jgi:hypothetical protein
VDAEMSEYCIITLAHGQVTKVSPHRYEELSKFSWHATKDKHTGGYYARRSELCIVDGKPRMLGIRMSRQILGLGTGDPRKADHKNLDTLDNTDENLRISTNAENARNKRLQRNNTTGYKGVRRVTNSRTKEQTNKWMARIRVNSKAVYLGVFDSPEKAHAAYCKAATELHGEFARFK